MRRVVILNRAAEDLEAGRDFYDRQKAGVGDYFKNSLIRDIEELIILHGIHPVFFGFYRMLAGRFPFGIYYRETEQETQVIAILDLRRDPRWVYRELDRRNR